MSNWEIKDKNGNSKLLHVKNIEFHDAWMGEEYVTVKVSSPEPISFAIGDNLTYRGLRYKIFNVPSALKQARRSSYGEAFVYENVKFSSMSAMLYDVSFKDFVLYDNIQHYSTLPVFSFYCNDVDDYLDRLQANSDRAYPAYWLFISPSFDRTIQRCLGDSGRIAEATRLWEKYFGRDHSISPVYSRTNIDISVSDQSVGSALAGIKDYFDLNFTSRDNVVIVGGGSVLADHVFKYGKDNGLKQIERIADSEQQVVTRLYAYGSNENLPIRYYAEQGTRVFGEIAGTRSNIHGINTVDVELSLNFSTQYFTDPVGDGTYRVLISHGTYTGYCLAFSSNMVGRDIPRVGVVLPYSDASGLIGTELDFLGGVIKANFPRGNKEYDPTLPATLAIDMLMLPGFPKYSLAQLFRLQHNNNKTQFQIRKSPTDTYATFLELDGNVDIRVSNDKINPYIESVNIDQLGLKEGVVRFTEENNNNGLEKIRPSIEGMTKGDIGDTPVDERLDEISWAETMIDDGITLSRSNGGNPKMFNVRLKNIGFNLYNAYVNGGKEMTLEMKDGYCGGRSFKVLQVAAYDNGGWTLTLERDETLGQYFPYSYNASIGQEPRSNEAYQIRQGDHFVLAGIDISDTSYIWAASVKALKKSILWILNNDSTKFTYTPKVDEIFMARQHDAASRSGSVSLHDTLKAGDILTFEDDDLGISGTIFIDSISIKENGNNGIPTYDIVLRSEKKVGTLQRVERKLENISSVMANGAGGLTIPQVQSIVEQYGNDNYISKKNDDSANGIISFLKGTKFGQYIAGKFGGKIDEEGNAELNSIVVRESVKSKNFNSGLVGGNGFGVYKDDNGYWTAEIDKLIVRVKAVLSELEIRKLSYAGGNFTFSPSGSVIESVVPLNKAGEKITGEEKRLSLYRIGQKFIRAVNGILGKKTTVTPASQTVYAYRCYNVADDGTTATMNNWKPGDQARCQTGNLASHSSKESLEDVAQNRHYWRLVLRTGSEWLGDGKVHDYVDIAAGDYDEHTEQLILDVLGSELPSWAQAALGSYYDARRTYHLLSSENDDIPQAGDVIVSEGHQSTDTSRQNVVRIITNDDSGGAIIMYTGIDDFSLPLSKETFRASADLFRVLSKNIVITTDNGATESLDSYISGGTNILGGVKDGLGWEFRLDGSVNEMQNSQMTWSNYNVQLENGDSEIQELCLVSPVLYLEAGAYCFSLDKISNTSYQAFIAQSNTLSDFDALSSNWASGAGKNRVDITLYKVDSHDATNRRYRTLRLNVGSYKYSRIVLSYRYDVGESAEIEKLQLAKGGTSVFHEPTPTGASMFKMTNDNISLFVTDALRQRTGINITNGLIRLIAERVAVQTPSGTDLAVFEMVQSSGGTLVPRFKTNLIQAEQVVTNGLKAQTIDAEGATIENLNVTNADVSGVLKAKVLYRETGSSNHSNSTVEISPENLKDIMVIRGRINYYALIPSSTSCLGRVIRFYGINGPITEPTAPIYYPQIKIKGGAEQFHFLNSLLVNIDIIRLYPYNRDPGGMKLPYVEIMATETDGWVILECVDCQLVSIDGLGDETIYAYKTNEIMITQ